MPSRRRRTQRPPATIAVAAEALAERQQQLKTKQMCRLQRQHAKATRRASFEYLTSSPSLVSPLSRNTISIPLILQRQVFIDQNLTIEQIREAQKKRETE